MTGTPKFVAITGAGSGIGAELAQLCAAPGRTLFLAGRRAVRLEHTAGLCRDRGATVGTASLDVRDGGAVAAWIDTIETVGPVDLMIVNAGIFGGRPSPDAFESGRVAEDIVRTNLIGAIHCAGGIAPRLAGRRAGHIVLISSLGALAPMPDAPAYSASKAGLSAYGEALREDLAPYGVKVTLIHPGHVATTQTERHVGALPLMVSPAEAARRILDLIEAGHSELSFPWAASTWVRLCRLLPWRIRAWANRSARFTVRDDADAAEGPSPSDPR